MSQAPNVTKLMHREYGQPIRAQRDDDGQLHLDEVPLETEIRPDCLTMDGVFTVVTIYAENGEAVYHLKNYNPERGTFEAKRVYDHTE